MKNEKRFNMRKLNQFPFIISLLHSNVKKLEHLKTHIYLNYEFMHAAASSGKMEYFVENHEKLRNLLSTLNKLNDESELLEISNIYKNNYLFIQLNPDLLMPTLLSQLKSRSEEVMNFANQSNKHNKLLIPLSSYVNNENKYELFRCDKNRRIRNVHYTFTFDYIMAIQEENIENNDFKIKFFNQNDKRLIASLSLINKAKFFQIYLSKFDNSNESLEGEIYSSNGNNDIYITELDNYIYKIKSCSKAVEGILMISKRTILIHYSNSFEIVCFDNERVKINKDFGEHIDAQARSKPKSLHHVYEWKRVGNKST